MKKLFLPLLIIIVLSSSCSKWGWVTLQYPNPPQLTLSENIKTIAIVNRSLVKEDDKNKNLIETVASAEVGGSDKLALDECLKAVFDRMNGWSDITIVIPEKTRFYGTGTRETPELLSWDTVKAICDANKADVLLVLENFDSNSDLVAQTVTTQVGAVISGQPQPVVPRQIRMNVISYWRLYDPRDKKIIDQYQTKTFLMFDNPTGLVVPAPDALPQTAYAAGSEYISRFLPSYYVVRRDMYKRGKGNVKQQFLRAFRHAETGDWKGAMDLWQPLTNHPKRKAAGRACLNMAVGCEVNGDFQAAYDWANKAYVDYRDKTARYYVNALKYRLSIE